MQMIKTVEKNISTKINNIDKYNQKWIKIRPLAIAINDYYLNTLSSTYKYVTLYIWLELETHNSKNDRMQNNVW